MSKETIPESDTADFTFFFPPSSTLKAHRTILQTKCEFFRGLFSTGMADASVSSYTIDGTSLESFRLFLHFLYFDKLSARDVGDPRQFSDLFHLGNFFGCPELCSYLLNSVNMDTFLCAAEIISHLFPNQDHIPKKFATFATNHILKLTDTHLKSISDQSTIISLLKSANASGMNCPAVRCFKLIDKWTRANGMPRIPPKLLDFVNFENMWPREFQKWVVGPSGGLIDPDALETARKRVPTCRDWTQLTCEPIPFLLNQTFSYTLSVTTTTTTSSLVNPNSPERMSYSCDCKCCQDGLKHRNEMCMLNMCCRLCPNRTRIGPSLVYVCDPTESCVHCFNARTGGLIQSFYPFDRDNHNAFLQAVVSKRDGRVFVQSDTLDTKVVRVFSRGGVKLLSELCIPGGKFSPAGLAMDDVRQEVHVCDRLGKCIRVFSATPTGGDKDEIGTHKLLRTYGNRLNRPTAIAIDEQRGLVVAADYLSSSLSVFRVTGEFLKSFGREASFDRRSPDLKCAFTMWECKFLAVDTRGGHVIVSDKRQGNVQVLTWDGEWVAGIGRGMPGGLGKGLIRGIRGVTFDSDLGRLFVCCVYNGKQRVLCF